MKLPKWCITGKHLTTEEQYIINAYVRGILGGEHYTDEYNFIKDYYVFVNNGKYFTSRSKAEEDPDYRKLTFDQFKKYILKEKTTDLIYEIL